MLCAYRKPRYSRNKCDNNTNKEVSPSFYPSTGVYNKDTILTPWVGTRRVNKKQVFV